MDSLKLLTDFLIVEYSLNKDRAEAYFNEYHEAECIYQDLRGHAFQHSISSIKAVIRIRHSST